MYINIYRVYRFTGTSQDCSTVLRSAQGTRAADLPVPRATMGRLSRNLQSSRFSHQGTAVIFEALQGASGTACSSVLSGSHSMRSPCHYAPQDSSDKSEHQGCACGDSLRWAEEPANKPEKPSVPAVWKLLERAFKVHGSLAQNSRGLCKLRDPAYGKLRSSKPCSNS